MKKYGFRKVAVIALGSVALAIAPVTIGSAEPQASERAAIPLSGCYVYGKLLAGKVQVVTTSLGGPKDRVPTFKVQVVSSFPNLKVQVVNSFPNRCGKWKFVNSFPDFKIRYVNSFPDFKIKLVNSFPGL